MNTDLANAAVCRSIRSAPTLKHALESFLWYVAHENKIFIYTINTSGLNVRICRRRSGQASSVLIYSDLDFFIDLATIIREFAGRNWSPKQIAFQHWPPIGAPHLYFPNTRLLFDNRKSWIELARGLLRACKQSSSRADEFGQMRLRRLARNDAAAFVYAMKRKLRENASEEYPDVGKAAKIMGTSVRTLQRALSGAGVTYSNVVEHARLETAAEMLINSNLKIIDIAYNLGYQDPSHFSRAFRRISGVSPRDFRLAQIRAAISPAKPGKTGQER
jgi:AraC-like DNA-binding protein